MIHLKSSTTSIKSFLRQHKKKVISIISLSLLFFIFPVPQFNAPTSTVLLDKDGLLMGAKIADDQQWRFIPQEGIPAKFETCITMFEDQYFNYHWGINPVSIIRATIQNIKAHKVVSGGSTITMQTIRLARKAKDRNIKNKLVESYYALRYEVKYSKNKILQLYAANAPFGGNVVGLEAASWRYFKRAPADLSWAESATLAVLPNAPALIHPGRNRTALLNKRNALLKKLFDNGLIDELSYQLSVQEDLPLKPNPLPQLAPHLLDQVQKTNKGERYYTSIDYKKQKQVRNELNRHSKRLSNNEIHNAAAIVVDNATSKIIAYIGNADYTQNYSNSVDIIKAPRSSGSIIKPILFAAALQSGDILPQTLLADMPLYFDGFTPENYHLTYDGAVPASDALIRSLNVPFVNLLKQYSIFRFYGLLKTLEFSTLTQPADYYGLSLILGGAEVNLWDITKTYSGMARTLQHVASNGYHYSPNDFQNISFERESKPRRQCTTSIPLTLKAGAIWQTFEAMKQLNRPDSQSGWKSFESAHQLAWKTGTSFGFRDAWAVGVTPQYTIAVWVGNATGEGRPGLTGVTTAAPLLFDIVDIMKPQGWFQEPFDEFVEVQTCKHSGHLASRHCSATDTSYLLEAGLQSACCPYHQTIVLDSTLSFRVNNQCEESQNSRPTSWFVLPPGMAWYYKTNHPFYKDLPPFKLGCRQNEGNIMAFIYPQNIKKIYIPRDHNGQREQVVFEIAHHSKDATIYWHIDDEYMGATQTYHQLPVCPAIGEHTITAVDDKGHSISYTIIVEK